ncbi:uncharacterized protein HMPREF1541_05414 [Cyphellophora europaea CBS 101466]|uniref:BTB domain-containing protein n=1 Tax=Cyphellophora europaea (strain CBS 101466) TaxID=1220924 RepID=W2RRN5_CYPE1|nr:uncharacterized protein HMPREF1541_05414 [Cyphellophora europaea CBS 101466]ETN39191.1 hypothetical protein HMPREF1541_05414 [Cyphellophora europaea CBS 101466]
MNYRLWEALIQDDAESLRQYLANATYIATATRSSGGPPGAPALKIGSPASLGTSPSVPQKFRKSSGSAQATPRGGRAGGAALTRADVNTKDSFGRTLLHHAASQHGDSAHEFVKALLQVPFIDLYAQDSESGWTPLHRALYQGNIATAQALMQRDIQDATDYTTTAAHTNAGGLVKIKDHEGNSPFEVFQLTIAPRVIQATHHAIGAGDDEESSHSVDLNDDGEDERGLSKLIDRYAVNLQGDEVFTFGSNKNLTLGTGDEDDRHFPERIQLRRPDHLIIRLYQDHLAERASKSLPEEAGKHQALPSSVAEVPSLIANKPIGIQDVIMSKFHSAILTNDPISNLHICGFGVGGRLGTGDERTSFSYKCVQGGGLAKKRVATIALGQDHTIAICAQGEVFTWGSNRYGQLGYALPEVSAKEVPIQLVPRQLYGFVKKELVIGATASAVHSAIYTTSALFTFGKNEGQLGLMDADARSLSHQVTPRRVAPSVLNTPIESVCAIDRATAVLLQSHDVIVFTHYGYTRVSFRLEGFMNFFSSDSQVPRVEHNHITKVTGGGNALAAMSTLGEVFTIDVPKVADSVPSSTSTTNPSKARNALPPSNRIWSLRKGHMSATDVAVGQDGSVILCTMSGSVWRKEKRANIKSVRTRQTSGPKPKDYKFVRVPNLTRAIAVRSNAFGAFTAVRKDCDVTKEQLAVESPALWANMFPLLSFHNYGELQDDSVLANPPVRFWVPLTKGPDPAHLKAAVITASDAETDIQRICLDFEPLAESQYNLWITSNTTDVRFPVHAFVLTGRSSVMRSALARIQQSYYFSIPDVLSVEYGKDGQIQLMFHGADFLTLANLVLYLYTDEVIDVWHYTSKALASASRYRAVRTELMKIASALDLGQLERAARLMIDPVRSLAHDMENAIIDPDFFCDADVMIELANDAELPAHSVMLTARCPFFEGLFNGRAGGFWMSARRGLAEQKAEAMRVDLKHIDLQVFQLVLRHLYADTGTEILDDVVTEDFDEFAELLLEVLSVANELMIDRLSEICQSILGKYVNVKNVCHLLNTVSECQVTEFKNAALEYICLNLETMLEQRLLEDLEPELLSELDEVVQQNQLAYLPFARSNRAQNELLDRYPELIERLEEGKRRRIDAMRLRSSLAAAQQREEAMYKFKVGSVERYGSSPMLARKHSGVDSSETTPEPSPAIPAKDGGDDLPFDMDEDGPLGSPSLPAQPLSPRLEPPRRRTQASLASSMGMSPEMGLSLDDGGPLTAGRPVFDATSPPSGGKLASTSSKVPWQTPSPVSNRINLRDIMSETPRSRVSSLTQSLAKAETLPAKPPQKMSQKERKKQQQQAKQLEAEAPKSNDVLASTQKPSSPWQNVRKASGRVESPKSQQTQVPARPAMTMRQTVSGASPSNRKPDTPSLGSVSVSKLAQPVIQSIRHTPARSSTTGSVDAHTSMADILAQQQGEKTAIKEAVAKRSLQDIQQEQEFQAWWDSESRRVQEEEAQASAATGRRGKGGRGRGARRAGGRGGGSAKTISDEQQQVPKVQPQDGGLRHPQQENVKGGGAQRERGRGRERGQ